MSANAQPFEENSPNSSTKLVDSLLAVDAKRLARMLDIGLRTVRSYDAAGKLPKPVKIGSRVLWRVEEIRAWLAAGCPDREIWERIRDSRR